MSRREVDYARMNESEIEQFRYKLLDLRSELQDLEACSIDATSPVEPDQAGIGGLSRMNAMLTRQKAQEGVKLRQRQLLKIDGALRRIESVEYGKCFICEDEIDFQRLLLDPAITRCIKCVEQ